MRGNPQTHAGFLRWAGGGFKACATGLIGISARSSLCESFSKLTTVVSQVADSLENRRSGYITIEEPSVLPEMAICTSY